MATITKTLEVGTSKELLADVRNAGTPFFEKGVMIFAHRYVAGTDYAAGDSLAIEFKGANSILFFEAKEILAASNTNLNAVESDLTSGVGKKMTTAATNASSLAVEMFAIIGV